MPLLLYHNETQQLLQYLVLTFCKANFTRSIIDEHFLLFVVNFLGFTSCVHQKRDALREVDDAKASAVLNASQLFSLFLSSEADNECSKYSLYGVSSLENDIFPTLIQLQLAYSYNSAQSRQSSSFSCGFMLVLAVYVNHHFNGFFLPAILGCSSTVLSHSVSLAQSRPRKLVKISVVKEADFSTRTTYKTRIFMENQKVHSKFHA